jgi:hypothetical protein
MPNAVDAPDTHPDQGPVEPRPDDAGTVPGSTPVQTSPGRPNQPNANLWGTGRMLILLLKRFVVTYLSVVGVMHAAPAVRVGYSWASNNLHLLQSYITTYCLMLVCVCICFWAKPSWSYVASTPSVDCGPPTGTLQHVDLV